MNRLEEYDCYIATSHEERLWVLKKLKEFDIPMGRRTWLDHDLIGDYDIFPSIAWVGDIISVFKQTPSSANTLTLDEFLIKAGINSPQPYGDNRLKHYFLR